MFGALVRDRKMGRAIGVAIAAGMLTGGCATTESVHFNALANQTAIVNDGHPAIISRKSGSIVLVRSADRGMQTGGRPVFIVEAINLTREPIDLLMSNIVVSQLTSDGVSTTLPVISFEQLASEERNREIAAALLVGVSAGVNSYSAAHAGNPIAVAFAQSDAREQNEAMIANTIEAGERNMTALENVVLKDNTIMPGGRVGGVVHISPPLRESGQPETYTISVTLAGEVHTVAVTQGASAQQIAQLRAIEQANIQKNGGMQFTKPVASVEDRDVVLTYRVWGTEPSLLADYRDGRTYGFVHPNGAWQKANFTDVANNTRSVSKNDFAMQFPDVGLPVFPK
jgi:hypothetical protein